MNDTVPEFLIIGVLALMGVMLARDALRVHRWSPSLFRKYRSLGPDELAFTAQTFNAPLWLGRLSVDRETASLTATGRLYWGLWAFFLVGFWLVGFPWAALLSIVALGTINYVTEVHAFRRVLQRVTEEANQAP